MLNFDIDVICNGYGGWIDNYYFVESDGEIAVEANQSWIRVREVEQYASNIWSFGVSFNEWKEGSVGDSRDGIITITNTKTGQQKSFTAKQKFSNSVILANGTDASDYIITATDAATPVTKLINGINVSGSTMSITGLTGYSITELEADALGNHICAIQVTLPASGATGLTWYKVLGTSVDGQTMWQWFSIYRTGKIEFPVWKDTYCNILTNNAYADYELRNDANNSTIYKGRAYRLPSENTVNVKINEIVQNYLRSSIDFEILENWQNNNSIFNFTVYVNGSPAQSYMTWLDYSYEDMPMSVTPISFPITGELDRRQTFVCSWIQKQNTDLECSIEGDNGELLWDGAVNDGNSGSYTLVSKSLSETMTSANTEMSVWIIDTEGYIYDEMITYKFVNNCNKYNLIYLNKFGGWDTMLMKGTDTMTDTWTNYQIDRAFNNTTREYEREHYLKGIDKKIKMNTGWLTDNQSMRMDNLLESTKVYLENLEDGSIIPVIITDTSMDYKTTSNQGKKIVNYTINVQYSQQRRRR